jgi:predicted DNA-binding transcriptional regulator YafY
MTRTVDVVKEAIQNKHKCYVRYRPAPDEPVQSYHVAPLDIKAGKSAATKGYDYLWAYSYEHESLVSLRLDRVLGVEPSEETFTPADVMSPGKEPAWNIPRQW